MDRFHLFGIWLLFEVVTQVACLKYHITFLGRNTSTLHQDIGYLLISNTKNAKITSEHKACTDAKKTNKKNKLDEHTWSVLFNSPSCLGLIPNATGVSQSGLKVNIKARQLHVYQKYGGNESDGYRAIPDGELDSRYYVITYCSQGGTCQFAVTAVKKDTKVSVKLSPKLLRSSKVRCNNASIQNDESFVVELQESDTLHFESEEDLSGTYIEATKKVAVIVGARDVISGTTVSCLIEQIPPTNKWGKEFTIISNTDKDILKIVTRVNSTKVQIRDGPTFIIPDSGQFVELYIKRNVTYVTTSEPVLMMQIINMYDRMSMVLVQHSRQCSMDTNYYYCHSGNDSLITLVSDGATIDECTPHPSVTDGAQICSPNSPETKVEMDNGVCGYGICNGTSSVLIGVNWTPEAENCEASTSAPGDIRDNDCDGRIDEDDCHETDLGLTTELTSDRTMKYLPISSLSSIKMSITSTALVILSLQTSPVPHKSVRLSVYSSRTEVSICMSWTCENKLNFTGSNSDLTVDWQEIEQIVVNSKSIQTNFSSADTLDVLMAANYMKGVATITFDDISEKDCGKIYKGVGLADDLGKDFILPLNNNSFDDFTIYIYSPNITTTVRFYDHSTDKQLFNKSVQLLETIKVSNVEFQSTPTYIGVRIESTEGEVSVYLVSLVKNSNTSYRTGRRILPLDVLGPNYHLFVDNATSAATNVNRVCEVYAIKWSAQLSVVNKQASKRYPARITYKDYNALGEYHLLQADYPVVVFCGSPRAYVQIPPKETLGKKYFIPPLNISELQIDDLKADIQVVRTEPDTDITVDNVTWNGSHTLQNEQVCSIIATKPIQVHLLMRNDELLSNTVIPPIDQYGDLDANEAISEDNVSEIYSNSVDRTGATSLDGKVFNFTIMKVTSTFGVKVGLIAIPSRTLYSDINEICTLNETGGLDLGESCSGLNETLVDLSGQNELTSCLIHLLETDPLLRNISFGRGKQIFESLDLGKVMNTAYTATVDSVAPEIVTSLAPEQSPNEETEEKEDGECLQPCVCPCAWNNKTELSEDAIRERVKALQEKLILDKSNLSKQIRRLTSASDDRFEVKVVGIVGLVWLCVMFGVLLLLDINNLRRDLKTMIRNLRQACGKK